MRAKTTDESFSTERDAILYCARRLKGKVDSLALLRVQVDVFWLPCGRNYPAC
jgi:hypothetical protein